MNKRRDYSGPALFSYGFRPFFLAAILFAVAVIPAWLLIWHGALAIGGPFSPVDWHIHEMLFGYAGSVIAGFLFTAVPNWTGRMPVRGWPLAVLLGLWIAGRMAAAGWFGFGPLPVMAIDCAFLAAIAAMIAIEIAAGRNWRNLKVVIPVALLTVANAQFHLEAMSSGSSDYSRRLGMAVIVFLITLIGGRIVPSFTRNWLAKHGSDALPAPFSGYDAICLLAGAAALTGWTVWPVSAPTAMLLTAAAALHAVRLLRWKAWLTWRSPLLLMLHAAYLFIPAGLLAAGLSSSGIMAPAAGFHLLGIGAIGGMTIAVMMRASLGHTGRALVAGRWLASAFALIVAAAIVRSAIPDLAVAWWSGMELAGLLWTAGFAIVSVRLFPVLALRKPSDG